MAIFDPNAQLPIALQQRLDNWVDSPPRRQFQAYGPLTAYLQGHKFPTDRFLVKPQKLLRKALAYDDNNDDAMVIDDDEPPRRSFDSGALQVSNANPLYPDFTVEAYYGADNDDIEPDVIRVVIEVASFVREQDEVTEAAAQGVPVSAIQNKFRGLVIRQLEKYLVEAALRSDHRILGVAMLGNLVLLRQIKGVGSLVEQVPGRSRTWFLFTDPAFVEELNTMRDMQ